MIARIYTHLYNLFFSTPRPSTLPRAFAEPCITISQPTSSLPRLTTTTNAISPLPPLFSPKRIVHGTLVSCKGHWSVVDEESNRLLLRVTPSPPNARRGLHGRFTFSERQNGTFTFVAFEECKECE